MSQPVRHFSHVITNYRVDIIPMPSIAEKEHEVRVDKAGEATDDFRLLAGEVSAAFFFYLREPHDFIFGQREVLVPHVLDGALDYFLAGWKRTGPCENESDQLSEKTQEVPEIAATHVNQLVGQRMGRRVVASKQALHSLSLQALLHHLPKNLAARVVARPLGVVLPLPDARERDDIKGAGMDETQPRVDGINGMDIRELEEVEVAAEKLGDTGYDLALVEDGAADLVEGIE